MQIPAYFIPRWYQAKAIRALESGIAFAVWCWARRGGKDLTAFSYGAKKAVEQPMNIVLVWPTKKQGYDNFWTAVDNDGIPILDRIPKELRLRTSSSPDNMSITLINGSTIVLLGATDPDALRGANGKLYILSEFVDLPPGLLGVLRPVVAVNGGQIVVQSTPKLDGISGATFKKLFDRAKKQPNQYASRVLATEYLTDEELEEIRQDYIAEYGNDFLFRQEFLCDWGQISQTSYYGQLLTLLKKKGQIGEFPYDKRYPAYTVWDWGLSDNMAIGFFQFYKVDGKPRVAIIDSHETPDISIEQAVNFIKTKPYNLAWHFFPHDIAVRDSDLIERIEKFRTAGLINSSILPRERKEDGIERVAANLIKAVFNEPTTVELRRKLGLYKRKFNTVTGDYVGPEHASESHYSDMIRYLFKAIEFEFDQETCEHFYSQAQQDEYESELVETNFYAPNA